MSRRPAPNWLAAVLWWSTVGLSAGLLLAVLLSPPLVSHLGEDMEVPRVLTLFARDAVVRRTALASALGLMVTASVFFRGSRPRTPETRGSNGRNHPADIAGA